MYFLFTLIESHVMSVVTCFFPEHGQHRTMAVMLNYAGYCDACQAAVIVIRSSDAALKSCLEWLTMSYIISDSAYLIFSAVLQTDRHG